MRILHICQRDDPDIGGSLRVAEALVQEQRAQGTESWLLFLYGAPSQVSKDLDPYTICLGLVSSREALKGMVLLRRCIRKINPDIIHTHDGIVWPRFVYLQLSIPIVTHAHLPVSPSHSRFAWVLIKRTTNALIGISNHTINTWADAGFDSEKIHYIQNGVDLTRFNVADPAQKQMLRKQLGLPKDKTILLWLGRLHRAMKGLDRIERVAGMLPDHTVLVVVGNGPDYDGMLERNADLIQSGRLVMTGSTSAPQDYYKTADAFLFTSHYEPFGLVILEAVASGLPIIGFPVDMGGGATELLEEFNAHGLQDDAAVGDVEAAIEQVLRDPEVRKTLRAKAEALYSWTIKTHQVAKVYQGLLSGEAQEVAQKLQVLICQHGARHRYAIPRMLHEEGMLCAFYTDSSEESWIGKCVKLLGDRAPESWRSISRWDIRGVPRSKIHSSDSSYFLEIIQRLRGVHKSGIQLYHQRHRILSFRMREWGLHGANIIYSMYHENLNFVRWAKARGVLSVVDVFISPITDQVMEPEIAAFPDWLEKKGKDEIEFEKQLWEETVSIADMLVCPSEWVAEGVAAVSPEAARKTRVVPYGCSIDYQGRVNKPVQGRFLFAGRDPLRKGVQYLAQAATRLKPDIPELDIRIAGELPESVVHHPLCKDLNFLGQLDGEQMKQEYLTADALVLPALSEGFASVVAEALSAGCPVIVTKEAGSPVVNGHEGIVIPSKDADALAEALRKIYADRAFRNQCASNCLDERPFYSESAWRERLVDAIQDLVEVSVPARDGIAEVAAEREYANS